MHTLQYAKVPSLRQYLVDFSELTRAVTGCDVMHSKMTNLRLFQTERVCRRQFQFDENGRKFSKRIENTVGKGEIARYEQFLLFSQCFHKT